MECTDNRGVGQREEEGKRGVHHSRVGFADRQATERGQGGRSKGRQHRSEQNWSRVSLMFWICGSE